MMRQKLLFLAVVGSPLWPATALFAQGWIEFNNYAPFPGTGPFAPIVAPVYGVEPNNHTISIIGQTPDGVPAGTTVYHGALLAGTGFTVQLWGGPAGTPETDLKLCTLPSFGDASLAFRTGARAGFWGPPPNAAAVPNVPAGPDSRATLQVRAWDNQGGTITSWVQVMENAATVPHGSSPLFGTPFGLGTPTGLAPNLIGFQSFNLYVVPEPSVVALALAGGAILLCLRRRKKAVS